MFKKISELLSKNKLINAAHEVERKFIGKDIDPSLFLIPERFRNKFIIETIKEKPLESSMILYEKKDCLPESAINKNVVLVGFLNPVEVITFPMHEKPMYISYVRRRWRDKETKKDYYNNYEFHPEGIKATHEFANFLKEADREILDSVFLDWKDIRHIRKEDF